MKNPEKEYYLGFDIGTNSIGYAVTDATYQLYQYHCKPMWGVHLFDEAKTSQQRRANRTARRRLQRRKQRVQLLQEIFAPEIAKVDEKFFLRMAQSAFLREDKKKNGIDTKNAVFDDQDYTDKNYHKNYPTIHHLILDLVKNPESKAFQDIRHVYLACAWLVVHRGHFLYAIGEDNIKSIHRYPITF